MASQLPSQPFYLQVKRLFLKRSRRVSLIALLLLIFFIGKGSDRIPADPTQPLLVQDSHWQSQIPRDSLRVGAFNIHGGKGLDGQYNLERTAECLTDFDFVGLTEVQAGLFSENQATLLGKQLQMASLFVPAERRWWHDHFGNGLLTTVPIKNWTRIPLIGRQGKKYRAAVLTKLQFEEKDINILLVHLVHSGNRTEQLQQVIDLFLSLEQPAILMGDLNTRADDPQLNQLLNTPGVQDALQTGINIPAQQHRIDWIITRGLKTLTGGYLQNQASDHPLAWVELKLDQPLADPAAQNIAERGP